MSPPDRLALTLAFAVCLSVATATLTAVSVALSSWSIKTFSQEGVSITTGLWQVCGQQAGASGPVCAHYEESYPLLSAGRLLLIMSTAMGAVSFSWLATGTLFGSSMRYLPHMVLGLTVLQLGTLVAGAITAILFTSKYSVGFVPAAVYTFVTELVQPGGTVQTTTNAGVSVYLAGASFLIGLVGTVPVMVAMAWRHSTYVHIVDGY